MGPIKQFLAHLMELAQQARESYEAGTAFMRMRVWVLGVLGLDVLGTLVFVASVGAPVLEVAVWFEKSFPSNMIVIRNETGDELTNATLVLDGRYKLEVETMEPGPNGYEVNRAFRDESDQAPGDAYVPVNLDIIIDGEAVRIPVGTSKQEGRN